MVIFYKIYTFLFNRHTKQKCIDYIEQEFCWRLSYDMQIYKAGELWNIDWGQIWILLFELSSLNASLYQVSSP